MQKKGQITVFMILGLLILIIISMIIFFSVRPRKDIMKRNSADVASYIEQCVLLTTEEAFRKLGVQGGRMVLPENHLSMPYGDIAYGFSRGRNSLPGLNNMREDVQGYIRENIKSCLGDFSAFPQYEFTRGDDIQSEVIFAEKNTISVFTMPLSFRKGEERYVIDEFTAELPLRFSDVYDLAYRTMDDQERYPGMINLTFLGSQDIDVNILTYNDSYVYVFEDQKSIVSDMPYRFILGVERDE